jgi:hypothetical protein
MPSPNRVWHAFGGFARSDLSTAYEHTMKILLQMVDFHGIRKRKGSAPVKLSDLLIPYLSMSALDTLEVGSMNT